MQERYGGKWLKCRDKNGRIPGSRYKESNNDKRTEIHPKCPLIEVGDASDQQKAEGLAERDSNWAAKRLQTGRAAIKRRRYRMSERHETEIQQMSKGENYLCGYRDAKADILGKIEELRQELKERHDYSLGDYDEDVRYGLRIAIDLVDAKLKELQ